MKWRIPYLMLILCSPMWATISFHAVSFNESPSGSTLVLSLPTVSNNDYVYCVVQSWTPATPGSSSSPPFDTPSGSWTVLVDVGYTEVVGRIWKTGDATSITFTVQNGASFATGGTSQCLSYTDVDITTPIDGVANINMGWDNNGGTSYILYPSVSAQFTNDLLISIGGLNQATGGAGDPGTISGFTSRAFHASGPTLRTADMAWSSGATGTLFSSPAGNNHNFGILFLLKASGSSTSASFVSPTYAGIIQDCADFSTLYPQTGDLIGLLTFGAGTGTSVTGYNKVFQTEDVGFYTLAYTMGGSTTPSISGANNNSACEMIIVRNYNPSGGTLLRPVVDAFGTTTAVATSTSLATPSIAANSPNDLFLAFWSSGVNGAGSTQTWTLSSSLHNILTHVFNPPSVTDGILVSPPSNPTGVFTSTIPSTARLGAGAVTFIIASNNHKKAQVIQVN